MDKPIIPFSDFAKIDLRIGQVTEAILVPESQKLIKLIVDFGDQERIVFTGLQAWYTPDDFTGKKFVFVYNLEPKVMVNDEESQGMLLAVDTPEGPKPLVAPDNTSPGQSVH